MRRDKEGTKALVSVCEFSKRNAETVAKHGWTKQKVDTAEPRHTEEEKVHRPRRNAYSAQLIRHFEFDPTAKEGWKVKVDDVQNKVRRGYPLYTVIC